MGIPKANKKAIVAHFSYCLLKLKKVFGPGEVCFYRWFFFNHFVLWSKFLSCLAVPPIILTQTSHALIILPFNLFDHFFVTLCIFFFSFFLTLYIFTHQDAEAKLSTFCTYTF